MFQTANLSPMNLARLNAALDKPYRFADGVRSLRAQLERMPDRTKTTGNGMIDWSRTKFNRMNDREQAAYEAGLKARQYFYVGGLQVPKMVFDALA